MAQPHGTRVFGKRSVVACKAGSALAKGDIVQTIEATGTRTVDNAATNTAVFGITLEAIASGETGLVDRIMPGDKFWVKVGTGTVSATEMFKFGDITDETAITLTESNNDVRLMDWDGVTTDYAVVEFTTPESATPTVLA